jgi:hypothetical protein
VNAGTLKRDNDPCFALLDCAARTVEFVDLPSLVRGRELRSNSARPG